ncbi:mechanosensitive ion channel family protein [Romeria aff. gracilis LEGE 07310]|uniref:Mechanosensitive ion channel family protein n=1 Tax=Vasconcelosia minhoensis LEGE 07310 TaxID=915328 RepID=A0A8J7A586_9CYAN|nr:mechanosensitive ion channel family protein [Romeria gracilis]MBE9076210.1 mechanosensitive ion channel family protein [Romeria aff. gracilis LEGE 07310]
MRQLLRRAGFLAIGAISVLLLGLPGPLLAQSPADSPADMLMLRDWLPAEIQSLVANAYASTAPVRLDGNTLFWVSAPPAPDSDTAPARSAQQRAQIIQTQLYTLARTQPAVPLSVETPDASGSQAVIQAGDQFLMTVTPLDAQLSGMTTPEVRAGALTSIIRNALDRYQQERQPSFLWRQVKFAGAIFAGTLMLSIALASFKRPLKRRRKQLVETRQQLTTPAASDPPSPPTTALRERVVNQQQRRFNEIQRSLLNLAQAILWSTSAVWILGLFPYSRWLQTAILGSLHIPAQMLLVAGLAYAASRLSDVLIDRIFLTLEESARWAPERSQRLTLRFSTFSQVAKSIALTIILTIATATALAVLGIEIAPLLAGAGIIGIAISLASQSLIKDFINGFLILLEDQFGLGDVITVNQVTGLVENLNLRITQIRDTEGRLITVPNGQINMVQNLSKEWSQVDLQVTIAPSANINHAIAIFNQVAHDMSQDPDWQSLILEPPIMLGVDNLNHLGITLRLWIKTQPLQQWKVGRELRKRLKQAFDDSGIPIGIPQEMLQVQLSNREELKRVTKQFED